MENNDYGEDFIINLSIEGSEFEEVEVKVEDPYRSIRDLISNIIREFNLPKMDNGGAPIVYRLGQMHPGKVNPDIFDFEDEDGYEMCLLDYNVKPGDHLELVHEVIAG